MDDSKRPIQLTKQRALANCGALGYPMRGRLMITKVEDEILRSLRRISRAIDLHSRYLASTFGLTGPQLVCLRALGQRGLATPSELAKEVSLSQATITGIIDRLASRQLVTRERTSKDRRLVTVRLTDAGSALIEQAPSPLQERFLERLQSLADEEQRAIRDSLDRIVRMMDSEELEAAPALARIGVLDLLPEEPPRDEDA